jgi:hypothetical protein
MLDRWLLILGIFFSIVWVPLFIISLKNLRKQQEIQKIITDLDSEFRVEVQKLYSNYAYGKIDFNELEEKVIFLTELYTQFYRDLNDKILNKKRRVKAK